MQKRASALLAFVVALVVASSFVLYLGNLSHVGLVTDENGNEIPYEEIPVNETNSTEEVVPEPVIEEPVVEEPVPEPSFSIDTIPEEPENASDNSSGFSTMDFTIQQDLAACGNLNTTNSTLTGNISINRECFNFTQDNSFLDCRGFTIRYSGNGSMIHALNRNNITIRNCIIIANASLVTITGLDTSTAINLTGTNNSRIYNNVIRTNNTYSAYGITLNGSNRNLITNNSIRTSGSIEGGGGGHHGILVESSSDNNISDNVIRVYAQAQGIYGVYLNYYNFNNRISNNTIIGNGSSSVTGVGISNGAVGTVVVNNTMWLNGSGGGSYGVWMSSAIVNTTIANNSIYVDGSGSGVNAGVFADVDVNSTLVSGNLLRGLWAYGMEFRTGTHGQRIVNNTIRTNGTDQNWGISLSQTNYTFVSGNNITTNGSGYDNSAVYMAESSYNNITYNTMFTDGAYETFGVYVYSSQFNYFGGNNITTHHFNETPDYLNDYAISFQTISQNNTFNNTRFIVNGTFQPFIYQDDLSGNNNFTNTSFESENGSILLTGRVTTPLNAKINASNMRAISNNIFVNTSNSSFLNSSAILTFRGLNFTDPTPIVDFNNNGVFVNCTASRCTEISYSGGVFIFNVSGFSTYRAEEYVASNSSNSTPSIAEESSSGGGSSDPVCTDECTGGTDCNGGYLRTCGNYDDDSCLEYSQSACAIGTTCKSGACVCAESWECGDWTCTDNVETRICEDSNACGTIESKPVVKRSCVTVLSKSIDNERHDEPLITPIEESPQELQVFDVPVKVVAAASVSTFAFIFLIAYLLSKKHHQKHHRRGRKSRWWFMRL